MKAPLVGCALAIGASLIAGLWISHRSVPTAMAVPVPLLASATPAIHVALTPIVAEPAPAPPLPDRKPKLEPGCVDQEPTVSCRDTGFPAISGDGTTIVDVLDPDDGERGWSGLMLVFIDAKTAKTFRSISIVDERDPSEGDPPGEQAKILRRTQAAQRTLDAAKYRSLRSLGETQINPGGTSGDPTQFHSEWDLETLKIVDPRERELGRYEFTAPGPGSTEHCSYQLAQIEAWWDPAARRVFGRMSYRSGDFCGSPTVEQVFDL